MPASPKPRHLPAWLVPASLLAATLAAYWPALAGGLIWDDDFHITRAAMRSLHGLWRTWFDLGATQQYYPLLHSAFWLEHRLWGDAVLGYHLVNVLLHATAAFLVVLIVRRLALPGAWLAGLIFAVHPAISEGVAWISEQKNTLSAVFCLAALLVYLRFDESRRRQHYLWALALFVMALLSKTVTATLPAALLVILWWKRGHLDLRRDVRPLVPWLALGAAAGIFTAWVERVYIHARGAEFDLSLLQHVLLAPRILFFYAAKLLLPWNLTFTYPRWTLDPSLWWQWLFPLALIVTFVLALRSRAALASLLLFAGTLFPVLGFVHVYPFRFAWVADHFQYLASLALIVPIAVLLSRFRAAWLVVVPLVLLTFVRAETYRDAETLYRDTIARNPASWMAHNNLGVALGKIRSHEAEALAEYQAALRIKPDYAEPHNNIANILSRQPGRLPDAIAEVQTAIRLKPDYAEAYVNLGHFLAASGRVPEALASYQEALRINPDSAEAHNNLGLMLGSVPHLQAAVALEPDNPGIHDNLAAALMRNGHIPEAVAEVQAGLAYAPDDPEAHDFLGRALSQIPGRLPDAISEFQAALRIAPGYSQAHNDLGVVLLYVPYRRADAIAEFRAALSINPSDPLAQRNLQRALAQP